MSLVCCFNKQERSPGLSLIESDPEKCVEPGTSVEYRLKHCYSGRWLTGRLDNVQVLQMSYEAFIESLPHVVEK